MTEDEIALRAFAAGILTSKMWNVEGLKVVRARVDVEGEPPRIDLEFEGYLVEVAVLSAKRVENQQKGLEQCEPRELEWREVTGRASQKLRHTLIADGAHVATIDQSGSDRYIVYMAFGTESGGASTLAAAKELAEEMFADAQDARQQERRE